MTVDLGNHKTYNAPIIFIIKNFITWSLPILDMYRQIFHCPYCNLCRLGKGLGIDFFHCMICNACMDQSLTVHMCREKCLEDFCPICHEFMFTSSAPIKSFRCGHLMHSACFRVFIPHKVPFLYHSTIIQKVY